MRRATIYSYLTTGLVSFAGAIGFAVGFQMPVASQGFIPSTLPARSLLQLGVRGAEVQELQGVLNLMGLYGGPIDGTFSSSTQSAVVQFQQLAGLQADGIVGQATWLRLLPPAPGETAVAVIAPAPAASVAAPAAAPVAEVAEPVLRKGAEGPAVSRLQRRLQRLGFYNGEIDGGFGEATEAAVIEAQQSKGLDPDGVVGEGTWNAIR
jgi:N-acetylmuramoyl-L-alanine amidase